MPSTLFDPEYIGPTNMSMIAWQTKTIISSLKSITSRKWMISKTGRSAQYPYFLHPIDHSKNLWYTQQTLDLPDNWSSCSCTCNPSDEGFTLLELTNELNKLLNVDCAWPPPNRLKQDTNTAKPPNPKQWDLMIMVKTTICIRLSGSHKRPPGR